MLISMVVNLFGVSFKFDWISIVILVCGIVMSYCFTSKKVIERFDNVECVSLLVLQILFEVLCGITIMIIFSMGR